MIDWVEHACRVHRKSNQTNQPCKTGAQHACRIGKAICTYREMTHRVTFWPCCKHFSGLGSFLLQSRNALLWAPHLEVMCLEADIKTAEVVMGASTAFSPIVAPAPLVVIPDPRFVCRFPPFLFSSLSLSLFASVLSSLGFRSLAMANLPLSPCLFPAFCPLS